MKNIRIAALLILFVLPGAVFSIDIQTSNGARLDIVSRTSFGVDLEDPANFGLSNELTQVDLIIGLLPYQEISNRGNTSEAVGFISLSLQSFSFIKSKQDEASYRPGVMGFHSPGPIWTNNYQPGEFVAGIAKGPWLVQLNAGGNEPFTAPWFKGMEYINDGFRVSWAYLDSVVDIRRINAITGMPVITTRGEENMDMPNTAAENDTVRSFSFEKLGNIADRFGLDLDGQMIAVMYNMEGFGLNFKLGTRFPLNDPYMTEKKLKNGLAVGLDSVFMPYSLQGLKIFASLAGTYNYYQTTPDDIGPDPFIGGTRIGYNIPLSNVISVEPWAGFDIGTKFKNSGGTEEPEYEVSFGATMRWPGEGGWRIDYITNSEGRVYPGMSVGYKIYQSLEEKSDPEHSIRFTLFEPRGDEGMFYKIGSEIVVDLVDLTNITLGNPVADDFNNPPGGFSMLGTIYVDFEIGKVGALPGTLVPWTILYYDNLPGATKDADRISDFKIDLGINLEKAIKNATFGLVWNSGSLIQNNDAGFIRLLAEIRL
jgi:hypothetical protein